MLINYNKILFMYLQPITDDDVDRIATCIRVLAEQSPLMYNIFNDKCRRSLSVMLSVTAEEEKEFQKVSNLEASLLTFSQFVENM